MIKKTKITVGRRKVFVGSNGGGSDKSGRPVGIIIGLNSSDVYKVNFLYTESFCRLQEVKAQIPLQ